MFQCLDIINFPIKEKQVQGLDENQNRFGLNIRKSLTSILPQIGIAIFLVLAIAATPRAYAQDADLFGDTEADSLLFGDEFDLGGDDFSFDFEEETPAEETSDGGDDFFGDLDEEEEANTEDAEAEADEWGFGDDFFAEDSTADTTLTEAYTDHPLDFRKSVQGSFMEGTGLTFSFYSPQVVNEKLETWYSHLDYSMSIELPWHYQVDPLELSFLIDISSFNFENSFPSGGTFKGVSLMPYARAEVLGFELEAGTGFFFPSFGVMAGIGYGVQIHSVYLSTGYRWNWAANIEPLGAAWWLEPKLTMGIRLW